MGFLDSPVEDAISFKFWSIAAIILISVSGSFLPLKLKDLSSSSWRTKIMELSRLFTAGVFLGVGLMHMLPEAAEHLGPLKINEREFPLAYFVCSLGFVVVWFLERHTLRDHTHMMAVAARANHQGTAASICFVHVKPVASYATGVVGLPAASTNDATHHHHHDDPEPGWPAHPEDHPWRFGARRASGRDGYLPVFDSIPGPPSEDAGVVQRQNSEGVTVVGKGEETDDRAGRQTGARSGGDGWGTGGRVEGEGGALGRGEAAGGAMEAPPVCTCVDGEVEDRFEHHQDLQQPLSPDARSCTWLGSLLQGASPSALHRHSHSAHHHHFVLSKGSSMAYILASLFSVHSFVVGAAFGIGRSVDEATISLLIAILAHKFVEAFAVGVQFVQEGVPLETAVPIIALYCAMTPLGICLGMAELMVQGEAGQLVENLTQAFGAGTVMYIMMMQLAEQESATQASNRWVQLALFLSGLGIMAAVSIFI